VKCSIMTVALCLTVTGCASSSSAERVCTGHTGRTCTSWEMQDTQRGKMVRENADATNRWLAQTNGTTFVPQQTPGGSTSAASRADGSDQVLQHVGRAFHFLFGTPRDW